MTKLKQLNHGIMLVCRLELRNSLFGSKKVQWMALTNPRNKGINLVKKSVECKTATAVCGTARLSERSAICERNEENTSRKKPNLWGNDERALHMTCNEKHVMNVTKA